MASKQTNTHEYITQAVAKAAIQTMSVAGTARAENSGPKMSRPMCHATNY